MTTTLYDQLERRILLLDGGFGTMVQGYGLQEEDYRGRRFAGWPVQLKGCNDLLALTRPDVVREIHEKYLITSPMADHPALITALGNPLRTADRKSVV